MPKENKWEPTPKQEIFLSLPYEIKEGFYAGALGAGKSDVLLLYPILHRFHENPEFKGLFLRRTFPELKNEIIPRSRTIFRKLGAVYNQNDKVWKFPSGALYFFGHCENEEDVHTYDSMQPNYVAFDELTSFTEWQYLYITIERNRSSKASGLPAITRSGSNPGNTGHNWVRKRFIDPCPDGMKVISGRGNVRRIFIPATIADNPHVTDEYKADLEALPEAEKQAKKHGRWDAFEGSVFSEYRDKRFPDEPENALHVIEPFDIPQWWPRICVGDWGFAANTWIGYAAISPKKRVILYREQMWKETKISEWTPFVKPYIDVEEPRIVRFCRSVAQDTGRDQTIQQQIEQELGCAIELSDNKPGSRVAGKLLLHEYLRWKPKHVPEQEVKVFDEELALWILRNKGLSEYKAHLKSFEPPEVEDNLPKLLVFKNCNVDGKDPCEFTNAIKACVYDKNKVEDVAQFDGDDPYDGGRYLVDTAARYLEDSVEEMKRVEREEEVIRQLQNTQDYTAYYRNMRLVEKEDNDEIRPIRRYRH